MDIVPNGGTCHVMEASFFVEGPNCTNCNSLIEDLGVCVENFAIDTLLIFDVNGTTIIDEIVSDIVCVLTLAKRPAFIFLEFIDTLLYSTDCSSYILDEIENWVVDILTCFDHIINDLSGGTFNSFFEYMFEKLLGAIQEVITGFKELVECFKDPTQTACIDSYPSNCLYDPATNLTNAGLQTCTQMAMTCIANITLFQPLTDIGPSHLNLLNIFVDLAKIIDDLVCPFYDWHYCVHHPFPRPPGHNDGLDNAIGVLECVVAIDPPFAAFARFSSDALQFLDEIVSKTIGAFDCMGGECVTEGFTPLFDGSSTTCSILEAVECMARCFTRTDACVPSVELGMESKRSIKRDVSHINETNALEIARMEWRNKLRALQIDENTLCGRILYAKSPPEILFNNTDWGTYKAYASCVATMSAQYKAGSYAYYIMPLVDIHLNYDPSFVAKRMRYVSEIKAQPGFSVMSYVQRRFNNIYYGRTFGPENRGVLSELWNRFTHSKLYNLTIDFVEEMQYHKYEFTENPSKRSDVSIDVKRSFVRYKRDFLSEYESIKRYHMESTKGIYTKNHRSYTQERLRTRIIEKRPKIGIENEYHRKRYERASEFFIEGVGMRHWSGFQTLHSYYHMITKPSIDHIFDLFDESKQYTIEYGFVDKEEYFRKRGLESIESDVHYHYKYNYSLREPPRKFGPILIDFNYTNIIPLLQNISREIGKTSYAYEKNMRSSKVISQTFNFNDFFINQTDAFISWFINGTTGPLRHQIEAIKQRFNSSNVHNFFENTVGTWLTRWLTCDVPQGFDGDEVFNLWCLPLLPEFVLDWVVYLPSGTFPMQIAWPVELILANCTNSFNGVQNLTDFHLSNNCYNNTITHSPQTDGKNRPLCPTCDFCPKNFTSCADNGFIDGFDNLMFTIGALPVIFNDFYNVPLDMIFMQEISFIVVLAIGGILFGPFGAIGFLLLDLIVFWTIQVTFGGMPWGLLVLGTMIIAALIAPSSITTFPIPYLIGGGVVVSWIISIFTHFTFGGWHPLTAIIKFTTFINNGLKFFHLGDITPVVDRILRFNYTAGHGVPYLDQVCWAWTFSNTAFAILVIIYSYVIVIIFLRITYLTILFLVEFATIILGFNTRLTVERMSNLSQELKNSVKKIKGVITDLKKEFELKMEEYRRASQVTVNEMNEALVMWRRYAQNNQYMLEDRENHVRRRQQ
jgi:hypothetical protein